MYLKKSNKMGKKDNVGIKNKIYKSDKKLFIKKIYFYILP